MASARDRQQHIQQQAKTIEQAAAGVRSELPNVENKTPWWATAIKWGLVALSIGGAIWLLYATGALGFVRLGVAWLRSLLPSPSTHRAQMDAQAIERGEASSGQREAIAAARTDPTFDAAYKRARKRQRKHQSTETS